jgi:signal transduction histidine kinase
VGDELGGLGLLGMEERAAMVGGTLTVDSRVGEGATIRLEIPTAKGHGHG